MYFEEKVQLSEFKNIDLTSKEDILQRVDINLINTKFLEDYGNPFSNKFSDLSMVYTLTEHIKDKINVHMFSKEELDILDINTQELHEHAILNAQKNIRFRIAPFSETIDNNMLSAISVPVEGAMMSLGQKSPLVVQDIDKETGSENILVCTIKNRPFGASYMFANFTLDEVAERFDNENFYIVPVSRHQAWFIRDSYVTRNYTRKRTDVDIDLLDMLEEFNDTQNKNWQDILSYQLYYYLKDDGNVIISIKH